MRTIAHAIQHALHHAAATAGAESPQAERATPAFASFKNDLKALKEKFPGYAGGGDGTRDV